MTETCKHCEAPIEWYDGPPGVGGYWRGTVEYPTPEDVCAGTERLHEPVSAWQETAKEVMGRHQSPTRDDRIASLASLLMQEENGLAHLHEDDGAGFTPLSADPLYANFIAEQLLNEMEAFQ